MYSPTTVAKVTQAAHFTAKRRENVDTVAGVWVGGSAYVQYNLDKLEGEREETHKSVGGQDHPVVLLFPMV